jgi:hypothetical protein
VPRFSDRSPPDAGSRQCVDGTHLLLLARGQQFTGTTSYASGSHIVASNVERPSNCSSIASTTAPAANAGLNSFENVGGCLQLVNMVDTAQPTTPRNGIAGANATSTNISNSNLSGLNFLYENSAALASMKGCGNNLTAPLPWNCTGGVSVNAGGTISASTTIDATAQLWLCNALTANVTLTVPSGSSLPGHLFQIKKTDASGHTCTVQMSGSDTLDGVSTYVLSAANQAVTFANSGGSMNWYVTATAP